MSDFFKSREQVAFERRLRKMTRNRGNVSANHGMFRKMNLWQRIAYAFKTI